MEARRTWICHSLVFLGSIARARPRTYYWILDSGEVDLEMGGKLPYYRVWLFAWR